MNKYECLFIIQNDASEEVKEAIIKKLQDAVTSRGGEVLDTNKWGTRRFAYLIDYKREGYYVLMNILAGVDVPAELERQVRITPEAIRIMCLKKD